MFLVENNYISNYAYIRRYIFNKLNYEYQVILYYDIIR